MNNAKKLGVPFTVWDTGFSYVVAPSEPEGHPHINMAVHLSCIKTFYTGNIMTDKGMATQKRKARSYCRKLNRAQKALEGN